ncbi:MAG: DUF4276 family protein [Magnetococcales bacterium]|nr:DUF4276 family protein [Magnetococcales bacterium]
MMRLLIAVEGQTEERFVKDTLAPHLGERGVWAVPSIVETRPGFRGGVSTWHKVYTHIRKMGGDSNAWVTMLFDFYGFPTDTPGYDEAHQFDEPRQRVLHLQEAIKAAIDHPRMIPFLALHELEAWLFCAPDPFADHFGQPQLAEQLRQVVMEAEEPERINHGKKTHPKAQLERIQPSYKEVADGATLLNKIGIGPIRAACPHFAAWLERLEQLGHG